MASLYQRKDSPTFWVRYKGLDGSWKSKNTGYRPTNQIEKRQAERLADSLSFREKVNRPPSSSAGWDWVPSWIEATWSNRPATYRAYRLRWRTLEKWLGEINLHGPANVQRSNCIEYFQWRARTGVCRNTALWDLKFLNQVMAEAVKRGMATSSPAKELGIKKEASAEKATWTDAEIATVDRVLATDHKFDWLRVTFLLGRYQAARLGSCAVPLSCVDLSRGTIGYPDIQVKGGKGYSQPIDKRLMPSLTEIVEHRRSIGADTLCDLPAMPSLMWRQFLDVLGIKVSHHSLRVTWITKAALAEIPESIAQRFSNHSSNTVHRIYMRFTNADLAGMLDKLVG
jgi:hypothetical protein